MRSDGAEVGADARFGIAAEVGAAVEAVCTGLVDLAAAAAG